MIRQFLIKRAKIARAIFCTYLPNKNKEYNDHEWWDNSFYTDGISDRQTLSAKKNALSARYHYNSVELLILRHLCNHKINMENLVVLDIGSGSGHWIDFYKSLGSLETVGLDVSLSSCNYLKDKYSNDPTVTIHHGKASQIIEKLNKNFSVINAVGVMFHIINDQEWSDTINRIAGALQKNGLLIVGGHFGFLDGLNVQIDKNGQINKRLRSRKRWENTLKNAGFTNIKFYKNNMYLWINDSLPQNNVLVATKL